MSADPRRHAWLYLCSDGAGTRIHVTGACERAASWPTTARPAEIDELLLEIVGDLDAERILVHDARRPAALLSRPAVAQAAAEVRDRLRDLLAATLVALPTQRDCTLAGVAQTLGVTGEDARAGAGADPEAGAQLCRQVAVALPARLQELTPPALSLVRELLAGDPEFDWLPWDDLQTPALDAAALEMLIAGRPRAPAPRRRERTELELSPASLAVRLLEADGPIAQALEHYEHRPGQVEMAAAVGEVLDDGGVLMVEAGTGVGKSLAYLVPAILWARANAEPVVVSTNTKNLQEQLLDKDLPLLREAMDLEFDAALLKGRSNYVCVRRFMAAVHEAQMGLLHEERRAAAYLVSWLAASETCDLDMIPSEAHQVFGGLRRLLGRVRSERALCLGPGCPHARCCPMRVARAIARNADIIVSNHALTLADTQFDVLPKSSRIIFDEAHNLESVATDQLGYEVSNFAFTELRRTLGATARRRGVLDSLSAYLSAADAHKAEAVREPRRRLLSAVDAFDAAAEQLGAAVIDLCVALDPEAEAGRARLRLDRRVYASSQWQVVGEAVEFMRDILTVADDALGEIAEVLAEGAERGSHEADLAMEAGGARAAAAELAQALTTVTGDEPGAGYVAWGETVRRSWGEHWRLCAAPIDVGPALQRAVYEQRGAVVMTSATLTVDGGFGYMRQRLGLEGDEFEVREQIVPSPFSYPEQLLLCVPHDIPTRGEEGRSEALTDALLDVAKVAGGGLLVLFTARAQMERVFEATSERLADLGLAPLCQYLSGPRSWLLQQLRDRDNAVLYGLKSFWEGVDVPGQALRCVVIVKLPFAVPTDPIVAARCELAAERAGDGGSDYYIPEAILGFKQGFGRLVRSTSDQGVVFVLDNRLLTRSYGRRFLHSIPQGRLLVDEFHECLREAERWLARARPMEDRRR